MGHEHHHGDASPITDQRTQRILTAVVGLLAVAALVGLVLLWPSSERELTADELGLGAELVDATVSSVEDVPCFGTEEDQGFRCDLVTFDITSGSVAGETGSFEIHVSEAAVRLSEGDDIVVGFQEEVDGPGRFFFEDFQRKVPLMALTMAFVVAVVLLGRWKGVRALLGLCVTGVVVVTFLFPSLLDGNDPTLVALTAAAIIALTALYLTHGVTERTTVALFGILVALGVTAGLAALFTELASFTGFSSEDAFYLQVASSNVDIRGLVLAGIIIGSLGVLDDVTVTQVSAVWQIHKANPSYSIRELYRAGVSIGRDHIASTVNTLVLAYAGASLPLLLVYTQAGRALTDVANGELVAAEVVRTLVGSIGLVTAVPVTTALAAWVVTKGTGRAHGHEHPTEDDDAATERVIPTAEPEAAAAATEHEPAPAPADEEEPHWEDFAPPDRPRF